MSKKLRDILDEAWATTPEGKNTCVLHSLEELVNTADRVLVKAYISRLQRPVLLLDVGLRSHILESFQRFDSSLIGSYLPCDIPALIPAIALLVAEEKEPLAGFVMQESDMHLVLTFSENKTGMLATHVMRFITRWTRLTETFLSVLRHDPLVGGLELDWREFLAGESGYMTMPWYQPLNDSQRALVLERIIVASKTIITSVLGNKAQQRELVRNLIEWLNGLRPLSYVHNLSPSPIKEAECCLQAIS